MNRRMLQLLVLSVALLALLIGCGAKEEQTTDVADVTAKVAEATEEVVETVAEGFDGLKAEYVTGMKTTVEEWNTKIADCEAKMTALPEVTQKPLSEPVKALKEKGAALAASVAGLEGATEETFVAEQTKVEESVGEVKTAYDKVMGLF